MTEDGSSFKLSSPRPSASQGVVIKELTGVEASPSRGLFDASTESYAKQTTGQTQETRFAVFEDKENLSYAETRFRRVAKLAPTEFPAVAQPKAPQSPCSTVLAFQFSHLELQQTGQVFPTPLSPTPSSLRTPASATSKSAYTPASAGSHHAVLSSLTPPRTPEERVLHLLADEPDEVDADRYYENANGLHIHATSCYDGKARTCDEEDDSSGDELSPEDLERLGISPLSIQASSCRTPVDDIIDLMLHDNEVGDDPAEEDSCAVSPVPYKERFRAEK